MSLLFSHKMMAVISASNKSTETFFKNGNEKQLEFCAVIAVSLSFKDKYLHLRVSSNPVN